MISGSGRGLGACARLGLLHSDPFRCVAPLSPLSPTATIPYLAGEQAQTHLEFLN
jgi:hypothetical protein